MLQRETESLIFVNLAFKMTHMYVRMYVRSTYRLVNGNDMSRQIFKSSRQVAGSDVSAVGLADQAWRNQIKIDKFILP